MIIKIWESSPGRSPVLDFLSKQHPDAQTRIIRDVDRAKAHGLSLLKNPTKMRKLKGHDLYEIKSYYKENSYRLIFCIVNNEAWILTAFKKQSDATPSQEIKTSNARKEVIKERMKK